MRLKVAWTGNSFSLDRIRAKLPGLRALHPDIAPLPEAAYEGPSEQAVALLLHWTVELLRVGGIPIFDSGRMLTTASTAEQHDSPFILLIPASPFTPVVSWEVFQAVLAFFQACVNQDSLEPHKARLAPILAHLQEQPPKGSNTPRFMRAAFARGIPVVWIAAEIMQYGYGAEARWLDSTIGDRTSQVGVNLARFKVLAAQVLRQAGLPVTEPRHVVDANQAIEHARRMGYPVVIKPGNLDGGLGVSAGLQDAQAVRSAFEAARKLSPMVLIEKHVAGRDYRLTVMDGEMLWAIERVPGGVTGDGKRTVSALVEALNANPRRGVGPHTPLKRVFLDDQALGLLAQRGMDEQSVPPPGVFVPLRSIANIRMGGHAVAVKDVVHPDNAHLAVRAAQALRLDLAGIDLLMPDIRRSWLETGAAICEVNAQPDLGVTTGAHLYGEILDRLLPNGGRIPIVLVVGAPSMAGLIRDLTQHLGGLGQRAGWVGENGVIVDDQVLTNVIPGLYETGQMLVRDSTVDVIVLAVTDDGLLRTGLPFDRFDVLVLGGFDLPHAPQSDTSAEPPLLQSLLETLLPSCTGAVIPANPQWIAHLGTARTPARILQNVVPAGQITSAVVEALGYPLAPSPPVSPTPGTQI